MYKRQLYISDSVEEVLGFSSEQLIGRKYTDFLAGNKLNSDIPELRRKRFSGDAIHESLRAVKNCNQEVRVLKVQTFGETDKFGNVIANHGIAEDVTEAYQKYQDLQRRFGELQEISQQLSERESTVLGLVMAGRLNKTIASELGITVRGVERVRSRLMTKFAANTSAQLVSIATEWKVLSRVLEAFLPFAENDSIAAPNVRMGKHRRLVNASAASDVYKRQGCHCLIYCPLESQCIFVRLIARWKTPELPPRNH